MSIANPELMRWLLSLRQQVELTNPTFAELNPIGWPIPFFGDIRTARVLTVGVNPSPTEFNPARWGQITNDSQWANRLLNYFHTPGVSWHKWFLPWETALRLLGCSYEARTAAHLDLSPRSTTVMGDIPEALRPTFCNLVDGDVHWLYEVLPFAPSARLILAAGSIIKPEPDAWLNIGAYLEGQAERHGAQIEKAPGGKRIVANAGCVSLPLHAFNSGPSAKEKFKLVEDAFTAREQLLPFLR